MKRVFFLLVISSILSTVSISLGVNFTEEFSILFSDDFNDGDYNGWQIIDEGTNDGPSYWYITEGILTQESNIWGGRAGSSYVYQPGTYALAGEESWNDYDLSLDICSRDNDIVGVMFRYQDSNNYYQFYMSKQYKFHRLLKRVDGISTILAADLVPYKIRKTYKLSIQLAGDRIEVYLDGELLFDVTDSSLASGKIALYSWGNVGAKFDNVEVRSTEVTPVENLEIITSTLPDADEQQPYSATLSASGGIVPYSWDIQSGVLPPGLTLDSSGSLSGTPTKYGEYAFTVQLTDNDSRIDTKEFSLNVVKAHSILFSDDFSDGDYNGWQIIDEGTNDGPSNWYVTWGFFTQESNIWGGELGESYVYRPGTYALAGEGSWSDYELSLDVSSKDNDLVGTMFRYQDSNNYYQFCMSNQYKFRRLLKRVDGVLTILAADSIPYEIHKIYNLSIQLAGNRIKVYLDGEFLFDVTDTSLASGKIALYAWGNVGAMFDNVEVRSTEVTPVENVEIITSTLPDADEQQPYSVTLSASGGTVPYSWEIQSGVLPPGLTLDSSGSLSGTPTKYGEYAFTVQLTDNDSRIDTKEFSLNVVKAHSILFSDDFSDGDYNGWQIIDEGTNDGPSNWYVTWGILTQESNIWGGELGESYVYRPGTYALAGEGSWSDYEFSLDISSKDNDLVGAMFRYQDSNNYYQFCMSNQYKFRRLLKRVDGVFTILAADSVPYEIHKIYNLSIQLAGNRIKVYLDGELLFDVNDTSLASGKIALYSWGNVGAMFDNLEVRSTEVTPIEDVQIITSTLPNAEEQQPYIATLSANGGTVPYSWDIQSGVLPPGLTLNSSGSLSGTPTESGSFPFILQVTDSKAGTDTTNLSITVISTLVVATNSLPAGVAQQPFTATLTAEGGISPYTWSILNGSLPTGLSLSANGVISGIPAAEGSFLFIASVTDSNNSVASKQFSLSIIASASASDTEFFPLALYMVPASDFPAIKAGGFNMVHRYDSQQSLSSAKNYLEQARANGLYVMQNMPSGYINSGSDFWSNWVSQLQGYDNLKCWYLPEEEMASKIGNISQAILDNDPQQRPHVSYICWDSPTTLASYNGVLDYLMLGSYPEYYGEPRANMVLWIDAAMNSPVGNAIAVVPAFGTSTHNARCDAYTAIIAGARGLAWYAYDYVKNNAELWNGLKQIAYEIAGTSNPERLAPVIFSQDIFQPIRVDVLSGPDQAPVTYGKTYDSIQWLQKEYKGKVYIFAVNLAEVYPGRANYTESTVVGRFSGLPNGITEVEVLFENRMIPVQNGEFTDTFNELDVHVYRQK